MHDAPPGDVYAGSARQLVFWIQRPLVVTVVNEDNEQAGAWGLTDHGFAPLPRSERDAIDRRRQRLQARYDAAYLVERLGVSDWKKERADQASPDAALELLGVAADERAALRREVMECLALQADGGPVTR